MSRDAIRLLGAVCAVGLVSWFALSAMVRRDSPITRGGRVWEIEFVWVRAEQFDREAECGPRPAVYLLGSSITRDAFDAVQLETELQTLGIDACVRKFAFGSGAPLFTAAMARKLDIRPGDRVLTSVAVDNFRRSWLDHFKSADKYVQFALSPSEIWAIDELNPADKVEYSLSWLPPRSFFQYQASFQNGTQRWLEGAILLHRPTIPERFEDDPFDHRRRDARFRDTPRSFRLTERLFDLSPTQTNIAALSRWTGEMQALHAEPWVVYVPPHPEHDPKFLAAGLPEMMHAWMTANVPHYARLQQLPDADFIDYKHPNDLGRSLLTAEVANVLARDWHSAEPR